MIYKTAGNKVHGEVKVDYSLKDMVDNVQLTYYLVPLYYMLDQGTLSSHWRGGFITNQILVFVPSYSKYSRFSHYQSNYHKLSKIYI